jgi:signal transduction histidine kinase
LSKTNEGKVKFTLQFVDISSKIFYDDLKAQEEFTSLINSTISHEMRNPLNSIISESRVQDQNIRDLKVFVNKLNLND